MRDFGYMEKGKHSSINDFRLWKRILNKSRGYNVPIFFAVILSLAVTGATLLLPYLIKNGIDNFITVDNLAATERISGLTEIGINFGILTFFVFVITFIQVVLLEWVGQSVMHRIRQKLFSHILDLDLTYLESQPTGRLVTRLTNDVQNMHEMFTSVLVTLFNDLLRLVGILIVLYLINFRLALIMTLFAPLSLIITVFFARLAREKFRAIRSQLSKLNTYVQEAVSGISIIQLFGRQQQSNNRFKDLSMEYLQRSLSQIRLFSVFMPLTELLSSAAIALILWYGGFEIIRQTLTLGELVAFLAYMRLFFQPLRELSQKYSIVQSALASAERIFAMLDTDRTIKDPENPVVLSHIQGRIKFSHLHFSYNKNEPVLKDVTFCAAPGETIAVVGTTGSGKTTLINLLLRFYTPLEGEITIDGINIHKIKLNDLRNFVGVILQDVYILQDSLFANIVMDTGTPRAEVETILTRTGMKGFVDRLPAGLETKIGEGGHELSTGEKQLLSFARALCRNPAIIVLDEATASIDSVTETILEQSFQDIFSGRTTIIIAHRLSTIRRADQIIVMGKGKNSRAGQP